MNILAINDSINSLANITELIKSVVPSANVSVFNSVDASIDFANTHTVEVVILFAMNGGNSGIEIAGRISKGHPSMNIIFYDMGTALMREAFAMRASGYIVGPLTQAKVKNEISNLRYAVNVQAATGAVPNVVPNAFPGALSGNFTA